MADTPTKVPLATTTLCSSVASYTFSSIPSTYTDLILVAWIAPTLGTGTSIMAVKLNSDTTNYSGTGLLGTGTAVQSSRYTGLSGLPIAGYNNGSGTGNINIICHFQNYSNTTTYKTMIARADNASFQTEASVGLWRKTPEAINSIQIYNYGGVNLTAGSTFTLYGIL